MKLFFSYGHTESVIINRIKEELIKHKYEVLVGKELAKDSYEAWIDRNEIKAGMDWRQKITEGIIESRGVIAGLSEHSMRVGDNGRPSVCLDELSIAIGVHGGNIITILLEKEEKVKPPASICHIQWVDMSEWREMYQEGTQEDVFEEWFQPKMQEVIDIVDSDDSRNFVENISYIKKELGVEISYSKQNELLGCFYVGREWMKHDLQQWVAGKLRGNLEDENQTRICVVYGAAGVGKSAFAAHFMHYNPCVAAGIFCEYNKSNFNNPKSVICALAYMLACRLPEYRTLLKERCETGVWKNSNEESLFDTLIAKTLSESIDGGRENMVIIIDGLDECGDTERNIMAEILSKYAKKLPVWLKIIITAREVSAVKCAFGEHEVFEYNLNSQIFEENSRCDIQSYFEAMLKEKFGAMEDWQQYLEKLTDRSDGIFLYASLMIDALLRGKMELTNTQQFPKGLSKAFFQWFRSIFSDIDRYKKEFREPLGVLLAAPEAMPLYELRRLFGWSNNTVNDFVRELEIFLRKGRNLFDQQTIEISHKYLNDWLDSEAAGCYRTSREDGNEYILNKWYEMFSENIDEMTEYEKTYILEMVNRKNVIREKRWKYIKMEIMRSHQLFLQIGELERFSRGWAGTQVRENYCRTLLEMGHELGKSKDLEKQRDESLSFESEGCRLEESEELEKAEEMYSAALSISLKLIREEKNNKFQRDVSVICNHMGDVKQKRKQFRAAEELYKTAYEIRKRIYREEDAQSRLDMANSYMRLGDAEWLKSLSKGEKEKKKYSQNAIKCYQEAMKMIESISGKLPEDFMGESGQNAIQRIVYNKLGDLSEFMPERKKYYEKGLKLAEINMQTRGSLYDKMELADSRLRVLSCMTGTEKGMEVLCSQGLRLSRELYAATHLKKYKEQIEKINSFIDVWKLEKEDVANGKK